MKNLADWVRGDTVPKPAMHEVFAMTRASIGLAKRNDAQFLNVMRRIAREVSKANGQVTIDDIRFIVEPHGLKPRKQNVWGAVFTMEFERLRYEKSRWPSNKSRLVGVWRWTGPRGNHG